MQSVVTVSFWKDVRCDLPGAGTIVMCDSEFLEDVRYDLPGAGTIVMCASEFLEGCTM